MIRSDEVKCSGDVNRYAKTLEESNAGANIGKQTGAVFICLLSILKLKALLEQQLLFFIFLQQHLSVLKPSETEAILLWQ